MNPYQIRLLAAAIVFCAAGARANSIVLSGVITQSTQDTGTAAVANPSLNNIMDGDAFSVTLNFTNSIASPGTFPLTSILFTDPSAGASESSFISGAMVLAPSGLMTQFAVLGCLIDTASCFSGNQLALDFQIPTALLSGTGVSAQSIPSLLPADLLEDGGSTDIQGIFTTYTYTGVVQTTAPEPSTAAFLKLNRPGLLFLSRLAAEPPAHPGKFYRCVKEKRRAIRLFRRRNKTMGCVLAGKVTP